jgi:hypothetical protein
MGLDHKKRTRTAKQLKAKSKVPAKSVQTPGGVAGEMQVLRYSNLKLEDRVADLERRATNLEVMVSDLQAKVSELAAALGKPGLDPKNFLPLSGDEC